jgi:hypothetical protein
MFRERFIMRFKWILRLFLVVLGIGVFRVAVEQVWNDSPLRGKDIVLNALWFLVLGAVYASLHALWEWLVPFVRRCRGFSLVLRKAYRDYWRPDEARATRKAVYPINRRA